MRKAINAINVDDVLCFHVYEGIDRKGLRSNFIAINDDDCIECNDPCHQFIPIEEVADPDFCNFYFEISNQESVLETESKTLHQTIQITYFTELNLSGSENGRINVASIDASTGVILLDRENNPKSDDVVIITDDEPLTPKEYDQMFFEHKMLQSDYGNWRHRKGEDRKPIRNNWKTLTDSKRQQENRKLLAEFNKQLVDDRFYHEDCYYSSLNFVDFKDEFDN